MNTNMQARAMDQALADDVGQAPMQAGPVAASPEMASTPMPGFPPELVQIAFELGLDIRDPQQLMILLQMLGQGGGGPMGPMAGAPQQAPQAPAPMPQAPPAGGAY
jgi:hypothetical protein